jgi:hypothetical protein
MWIIVIDLQIIFINFFILNTICKPIRIIHLNRISVHIQIRSIHHKLLH